MILCPKCNERVAQLCPEAANNVSVDTARKRCINRRTLQFSANNNEFIGRRFAPIELGLVAA